MPASGLVTALEPILRACDGTWVAHGSGDADRETVDKHDRIRVPRQPGVYAAARMADKEEEQGYYYGFANEGLWPLCHIAHTRPTFRTSDWQSYQDANRKFADVLHEKGAEHALLLVQDYHFALLPRMVKEARPDVRVAIFWHSRGRIRRHSESALATRASRRVAGRRPGWISHAGTLQQLLETVIRRSNRGSNGSVRC